MAPSYVNISCSRVGFFSVAYYVVKETQFVVNVNDTYNN